MDKTPTHYTPEEIRLIKDTILQTNAGSAVCPRCNMKLSEKIVGGGGTVSPVSEHSCPGCGATVTVSDLMR